MNPSRIKWMKKTECEPASWTGYSFPTCNPLHELPFALGDTDGTQISYLSSGAYRDAFRYRSEFPRDHFVMKRMRESKEQDAKTVHKIHKEAIVMERLSHSPRILDMHGYCGSTVIVEAMASDLVSKILTEPGIDSQKRLDELDDVYPQNNLTISEKLQIAIYMAESLADIHGFVDGPITHGDTHIEQWLLAADGTIKLNDFNNAREPLWNATDGNYCCYFKGFGGTYRSPEEFSVEAQDESVDTFAFGNNIYCLLLGLYPHYDEEFRGLSRHDQRNEIIAGKRGFVDERYRKRSYIESKLIEIMELCWADDPEERPSMFEVVSMLTSLKSEAARKGELKSSPLINIPMLSDTDR